MSGPSWPRRAASEASRPRTGHGAPAWAERSEACAERVAERSEALWGTREAKPTIKRAGWGSARGGEARP
jgi:hypothetical protein